MYPLHYVTYVPILRLLRPTALEGVHRKKRGESTDGRTDNWPNLVNYWYMLFSSPEPKAHG